MFGLNVRTSKNLGDEDFVRTFLGSWLAGGRDLLAPEYFDVGEPIRRSFEKEGLEAAVKLWIEDMPLMVSRRSRPRMWAEAFWSKNHGKHRGLFPWGCFASISKGVSDKRLLNLFRFFIEHFEPAYGKCTTSSDSKQKNHLTLKEECGTSEQWIGTRVGSTFPGLYWATYFGPWSLDKIGRERFKNLPAHAVEELGGGYLVIAYPKSEQTCTPEAHAIEKRIKEQLGEDHFFDRATINLDDYRTSPKVEAEVNRQIAEMKAAGKKSASFEVVSSKPLEVRSHPEGFTPENMKPQVLGEEIQERVSYHDKKHRLVDDALKAVLKVEDGRFPHGGIRRITHYFNKRGKPSVRKKAVQKLEIEYDVEGHEIWRKEDSLRV